MASLQLPKTKLQCSFVPLRKLAFKSNSEAEATVPFPEKTVASR